ncbi:MAG: molybdopterin converting factor subunit 1 [Ignavibacteriae bacterium]|nr:molybdopterin converting factor subunit 1 [Ignavibacteriota bacterium]
MTVHVKFFAVTRDIAGSSQLSFVLAEHSTTSDLLELLIKQFPKFLEWKPFLRIAINQEYITEEKTLSEMDEVALIPPVSGG